MTLTFDLLNGSKATIPLTCPTIEEAERKVQDYAPKFRPCTWVVKIDKRIILKGK